MAFDFTSFSISAIALAISLLGLVYTFYQNRRTFNVSLWLEPDDTPTIKLVAFNSGYRPVAIMNYKFLADNTELKLTDEMHEITNRDWYGPKTPHRFAASVNKNFKNFPLILKEGETAICSITVRQLASFYIIIILRVKLF